MLAAKKGPSNVGANGPSGFCPGLSKSISLSGDGMIAQGGQHGVT